MPSYKRKFSRIARKLRHFQVGRSSQAEEWDVFHDLKTGASSRLFLGVFGDEAIIQLLEEFGVLEELKNRGLADPKMRLILDNPYRHILRLYNGIISNRTLVVELIFRRAQLTSKLESFLGDRHYAFLNLEWILLQNPTRSFTADRPALPGQEYPGLGMADMILSLMYRMARAINVDGIITVPASIHSGLFFLKQYLAIEPAIQAELLSLNHVALRHGLPEIIWAQEWGDLLNATTGEVHHWKPGEVMQPVSRRLRERFRQLMKYDHKVEQDRIHLVLRPDVKISRTESGRVMREVLNSQSTIPG